MLVFIALGLAEVFKTGPIEIITGIFTISIGGMVMVFNKKPWIENNIFVIHIAMIIVIKTLTIIWALIEMDSSSAFSYLLITFICGLIIIKPFITALFFGFSTISIIVLALTADHPFVDVRFGFYVIFMGILITVFAYWRNQLTLQIRESSASYKNLFSDLAEQIFVLDKDMTILDLNSTAQLQLTERFSENVKGKKFNEIFCSESEADIRKFSDNVNAAWGGIKKSFEVQCAYQDMKNFVPKEFTLRRSEFFGKDVLILIIRSIQEQKAYEARLLESKESISRVLENISSFIFNIAFREDGDHQVNYVSNKVSDVYGIEADEYITLVKSGRLSDVFYHEDRDEAVMRFDEVIRTGQPNHIKFRIVRNGEIRWVEEKVFPKKIAETGVVHLFGIVTDITDQIEGIKALEQSEKRYRQMFERNLAGVYKTHVDGTIIDANQAFARILGYDSVNELKKKNIREFYCEQDGRKDYLTRLRKEGFINNHLSYLKRKDGKKIILNNNVSIQPDEDGNLNIIEGTLIDITEIEETSSALKLSEEKYRLLFEESKEGIFVISLGKETAPVVDLNQGAADLLGYSKEDIFGKDFNNFIAEGQLLKNQIEHEKASRKIETEWVFKRKDGSDFVAEISVVSFLLGQDKIVQLVFKDISERKHSEEILKESQRSFKNIVDNSPAAILIFSDNKLVYSNPLGEAIYKERLNHKSENIFEIFPASQKYIIQDLLNQKPDADQTFTEIELVGQNDIRKYSLIAVKTIYNNRKIRSDFSSGRHLANGV
ncbi:MAG: PAS domain S-box protein [Crocinitomicaceae bacterium]|nr:PAS domain S-box protein [Crocinitomicaceae bacterium]